jgi:hypothetical protein
MNFPFSATQANMLKNLLRGQITPLGGFLFGRVGEWKGITRAYTVTCGCTRQRDRWETQGG